MNWRSMPLRWRFEAPQPMGRKLNPLVLFMTLRFDYFAECPALDFLPAVANAITGRDQDG
jgi:hypothetical protein